MATLVKGAGGSAWKPLKATRIGAKSIESCKQELSHRGQRGGQAGAPGGVGAAPCLLPTSDSHPPRLGQGPEGGGSRQVGNEGSAEGQGHG